MEMPKAISGGVVLYCKLMSFNLFDLLRKKEELQLSLAGVPAEDVLGSSIMLDETCNGNCTGDCQGTCDDTCDHGCEGCGTGA